MLGQQIENDGRCFIGFRLSSFFIRTIEGYMKAILEFNLPEEEEQFNAANKGMDWALVVWDINQLLRDKLKYGKLLPNTRAELEEIRDTLNEMLTDKGLIYPS